MRKRLFSTRKSFGSFHSEDIETLVRHPCPVEKEFSFLREITAENIHHHLRRLEVPKGRQLKGILFPLSADYTFINHGAFGCVALPLLAEASLWRIKVEEQPLKFYDRDLFPLVANTLQIVAKQLGCDPSDLLPLSNVTTGLNAITRSIALNPGEEVIQLSLTYGSTKKILRDWCYRSKAALKTVSLPLPIASAASVTDTLQNSITDKTKVIILDHITSNTAMLLPIAEIAKMIKTANPEIKVIVDAAHCLFSLDIDLQSDAYTHVDYWLTNAHKWLSNPKGAAVMWVNPKTVHHLRPAIISHGYEPNYDGSHPQYLSRGKFLGGFVWDGCRDYSPWLTLPSALTFWDILSDNNWDNCRSYNRQLLDNAENILKDAWLLNEEDFACAYEMRAMSPMRLVPLPRKLRGMDTRMASDKEAFALQEELHHDHRIEVPIKCIEGQLYVRISAHIYNDLDDYHRLALVFRNDN